MESTVLDWDAEDLYLRRLEVFRPSEEGGGCLTWRALIRVAEIGVVAVGVGIDGYVHVMVAAKCGATVGVVRHRALRGSSRLHHLRRSQSARTMQSEQECLR